jgi:hypothetical protein
MVEQCHFSVRRVKESAPELSSQDRSAPSMPLINPLIHAPRVMKVCEQFDNVAIRPGVLCKHQTIGTHSRPVRNAMATFPVDFKLTFQVGQAPGNRSTQNET